MRLIFKAGKWDSWGFGISYCHYDRSLMLSFIHWCVFVDLWSEEEVLEYNLLADELTGLDL